MVSIFYSLSDIGKKRNTNEDYCVAKKFKDLSAIYMVLDGIGGNKSGEIASSVAAEKVIEYLDKVDKVSIEDVQEAIAFANKSIYDMSKSASQYSGMGTTIVALFKNSSGIYVVNIGDSRAYKVTKKRLTQLSQDDTYVNALIRDNIITKEAASKHPDRHVLLKALGVNKEVKPNVVKVTGRTFLLCTDGLTITTEEKQILNIINSNQNEDICKALVDAANINGGQDNITVVYVKF